MSIKLLKKFWSGLTRNAKVEENSSLPAKPRYYTVTTGLRIDLSVPAGAGKEIPASQFVWVSPIGSSRSAKALRVLLLSN